MLAARLDLPVRCAEQSFPTRLDKTVNIRGEPHSVPQVIHRSLAHCAYHVGQIVMIARILAKDDWKTLTIPRGESASYNERVWQHDQD